jgi:hypothetical protein
MADGDASDPSRKYPNDRAEGNPDDGEFAVGKTMHLGKPATSRIWVRRLSS